MLHDMTQRLLRNVAPPATRITSIAQLGAEGIALRDMVLSSKRLMVLTGAGISTESGIPDYRSPGRPAYRPMQHNEFMTSLAVRRRYWARSMLGWPIMTKAQPNATHRALAALQGNSLLSGGITTQNVDRLHQAAGATGVLELHGTIHEADCLVCNASVARTTLQTHLMERNETWVQQWVAHASPRPDGDVEIPPEAYPTFALPICPSCGREGELKPSVVLHGGNVPAAMTTAAVARAQEADALLLVGTTATVYSAYRLIKAALGHPVLTSAASPRPARAPGLAVPIGIVNLGPTRADELAAFKVEARAGDVMAALVADVLGLQLDPG